jgi:23S rRNA (pseudouridine1915-N3)-methyltransferase
MKIVVLAVGRTAEECWSYALDEYSRRLRHYVSFELLIIPDIRRTVGMSAATQRAFEGDAIKNHLQTGDYCILLDERGREMTSPEFAVFMEKTFQTSSRRIVFIIGGAYGFPPLLYTRSDVQISLSRMTFSHQMVRAVFVEQLYRAMTILRGESYHHGEIN